MTQPTTYAWFPRKERLIVPFESNQGRRINVLGAIFSHGPQAGRFDCEMKASVPKTKAKNPRKSLKEIAEKHGLSESEIGSIDGALLVRFVWRIAGRPEDAPQGWRRERPLVIVLDNYSVHKSVLVKEEIDALEAANVTLWHLPSYCPEWSDIEPIWRATKYREMTTRSYDRLGDLLNGVSDALKRVADRLLNSSLSIHSLRQAA